MSVLFLTVLRINLTLFHSIEYHTCPRKHRFKPRSSTMTSKELAIAYINTYQKTGPTINNANTPSKKPLCIKTTAVMLKLNNVHMMKPTKTLNKFENLKVFNMSIGIGRFR